MTAARPSLVDRLGSEPGIALLVARFFVQMEARPEAQAVRAMHKADLDGMIARLGTFLTGWLRTAGRSPASIIPLAHFSFPIGPDEVEQCRTDPGAGAF